mmetsp:Transcript_8186/g.20230  ORF Transcript_8186/g.20230 Transcript_8186/m.20230 type:complete len:241 (+) Transcript_8186:1994-2716(+)
MYPPVLGPTRSRQTLHTDSLTSAEKYSLCSCSPGISTPSSRVSLVTIRFTSANSRFISPREAPKHHTTQEDCWVSTTWMAVATEAAEATRKRKASTTFLRRNRRFWVALNSAWDCSSESILRVLSFPDSRIDAFEKDTYVEGAALVEADSWPTAAPAPPLIRAVPRSPMSTIGVLWSGSFFSASAAQGQAPRPSLAAQMPPQTTRNTRTRVATSQNVPPSESSSKNPTNTSAAATSPARP